MSPISYLLLVSIAQTPIESRPHAQTFRFGTGETKNGEVRILEGEMYDKERRCGFEPGASVRISNDGFCRSDKPFYFSVSLPERNYLVTLVFGNSTSESNTTVKAELRRLALEGIQTPKGGVIENS